MLVGANLETTSPLVAWLGRFLGFSISCGGEADREEINALLKECQSSSKVEWNDLVVTIDNSTKVPMDRHLESVSHYESNDGWGTRSSNNYSYSVSPIPAKSPRWVDKLEAKILQKKYAKVIFHKADWDKLAEKFWELLYEDTN